MGDIVVGYVPTPEGEAALETAIGEARLRGRGLVVVSSDRGRGDEEETAEAALDGIRDRAAAGGVTVQLRHVVRGLDPADDLVEAAKEIDAELLVIGLRRRSPVGKLILGSNAQRILLDASCPVLAVKA